MDMRLLHRAYRRDHAKVFELASELVTFASDHAMTDHRAKGLIFRGWAVAVRDDPAAGLRTLQEGLEAQQAIGTTEDFPVYLSLLAEALIACGQPDRAVEILSRERGEFDRLGLRVFVPGASADAGLRDAGMPIPAGADAAAAMLEAAATMAGEQQAAMLGLRIAVTRVRLAPTAGTARDRRWQRLPPRSPPSPRTTADRTSPRRAGCLAVSGAARRGLQPDRVTHGRLRRRRTEALPRGHTSHVDPEATLARVLPLAPRMGITRVAVLTGLDVIGIPVAAAVRPNSRSIAVHQGKGVTLAAAKASAVMEAVETFHAENVALPLRLAAFGELDGAVDPALLPRCAGRAAHRSAAALGGGARTDVRRHGVGAARTGQRRLHLSAAGRRGRVPGDDEWACVRQSLAGGGAARRSTRRSSATRSRCGARLRSGRRMRARLIRRASMRRPAAR